MSEFTGQRSRSVFPPENRVSRSPVGTVCAGCGMRGDRGARGFTLIELLVVIGIIVILIGILVPAVGAVRRASYRAKSQSVIAGISNAIEQYYQDFRAYPGPVHNDNLFVNMGTLANTDPNKIRGLAGPISGTENLVLALMGGLEFVPNPDPMYPTVGAFPVGEVQVQFNPDLVGAGARNLNYNFGSGEKLPKTNQKSPVYLEGIPLSSDLVPAFTPNRGHFVDEADPAGADDTVIPEFLDGYPDGLPVLYLRARVGAQTTNPRATWTWDDNSVVTGGIDPANPANPPLTRPVSQYDLNQILGYTNRNIGIRSNGLPHGLAKVYETGNIPDPPAAGTPYYGYSYFLHPTLANQARQKDGYILIGAGPDRTYGTDDDVCSFGDVK